MLTVPLDWIKNILFCDSVDSLIDECRYYGLVCYMPTKSIKFQRDLFDLSKQTVNFYMFFNFCQIN